MNNTRNKTVVALSLCFLVGAMSMNAHASLFNTNSYLNSPHSAANVYFKARPKRPSFWYMGIDVGMNATAHSAAAHTLWRSASDPAQSHESGPHHFTSDQLEWGGYVGHSFVVSPRIRLSTEIDAQYSRNHTESFSFHSGSSFDPQSTTVETSSGGMQVSVNLIPALSLTPDWQLFGRLGYVLTHQDLKANSVSKFKPLHFPALNVSQWLSGFQVGMGLQWKYQLQSKHSVAVRLEYDYRQPFSSVSSSGSHTTVDKEMGFSHTYQNQAEAKVHTQAVLLGLGYYF